MSDVIIERQSLLLLCWQGHLGGCSSAAVSRRQPCCVQTTNLESENPQGSTLVSSERCRLARQACITKRAMRPAPGGESTTTRPPIKELLPVQDARRLVRRRLWCRLRFRRVSLSYLFSGRCDVSWVVAVEVIRGRGSCWLFESAAYEVTVHSIPCRPVFRSGEPGYVAREIIVVSIGPV